MPIPTPSLCWLVALVVFLIVEGATVGLVSIWFAAGSLAALLLSLAVDNIWAQFAVFLAVSAVCILALRPLSRKYLKKDYQATNADRAVGSVGIVTETIDNLDATGAVQLEGKVWTARSADGSAIPAGSKVLVDHIEGVKLLVRPVQPAAAGQDMSQTESRV